MPKWSRWNNLYFNSCGSFQEINGGQLAAIFCITNAPLFKMKSKNAIILLIISLLMEKPKSDHEKIQSCFAGELKK
jgi:hypothetical protein